MNLLDHLTDLEKRPAALPYTGREYDLEGFRAWMAAIGNPQNRTPWIHIAGTKGKGSTAAMTEAILRAAGWKTGLFTSPHLEHYGQRFRFSGQPWTIQEFESALRRIEPEVNARRGGENGTPLRMRTVFEVLTAVAFREFAASSIEAGILETGLGGRLDCTNIVDPAVTAITPIGLDHTSILGGTIEEIAAEKAGILKPGRPAVLYRAVSDADHRAHQVIRARAAEVGAPVYEPWPVVVKANGADWQDIELVTNIGAISARLSLLGTHQAKNFALASQLATLFLQLQGMKLDIKAIQEGARTVQWPGRLEVRPGSPALVLDGAHCPLSAGALGRSLATLDRSAPTPFVLLLGMSKEKDHAGFLEALLAAAPPDSIPLAVCFRNTGGRGADPERLANAARKRGIDAEVIDGLTKATQRAIGLARELRGSILATGSLYALALIGDEHAASIV